MKNKKLKLFRNVFANSIIAIMLIFLMGISYYGGVLNVFSSGDYVVYYHGSLEGKGVSLMINVYWGDEYLTPMLDIFKEQQVQTTFFVGGIWAVKNNEMLKRFVADGHEIGNHGYFHKDHKLISLEKNQEEIYNTHQVIKSITGIEMTLFAPPSGSFSQTTLNVAKNLGYHTIMWNKDTVDWKEKDSQVIFNRAVKNASGGDLILMHPTQATLNVLEKIIEYFKEKGLNLTTVSKNIGV